MKRGKLILASTAFVGLTLTKMLFPDVGSNMRVKIQSALERDTDYVAAFRDLEKKLSWNRENPHEELAKIAESPIPTLQAHYISYYVDDAVTQGENENAIAEPSELPEVVSAFLARQAAYSDYSLPDNVDYTYLSLPFEYAVPVAGRQSSGFGYRLHPILQIVRFHFGTDVAANAGETIAAFADGTVLFAGYDESFGWHLKIDHGNGWVSHYCHCSKLLVRCEQVVSMGDAVALVGSTGLATGPHLHFELTKDGVYLNPEYYINA